MDYKGPSCLFHYAAGGASQLGIQKLHSSSTNKSIPELLAHKADGVPITDDKMQRRLERGHPYVFNLGGNYKRRSMLSCIEIWKKFIKMNRKK